MHIKWLDFEWNVLHIIASACVIVSACAPRLPLTACVVFFPPLHFEYGSSSIFAGCEQDTRIEILCAALLSLHCLPAHSDAGLEPALRNVGQAQGALEKLRQQACLLHNTFELGGCD